MEVDGVCVEERMERVVMLHFVTCTSFNSTCVKRLGTNEEGPLRAGVCMEFDEQGRGQA